MELNDSLFYCKYNGYFLKNENIEIWTEINKPKIIVWIFNIFYI
jgi:hypothetical protein